MQVKEQLKHYKIIICVTSKYGIEIERQLIENGIYDYCYIDKYLKYNGLLSDKIKSYKNKYMGKRCFIIGTGPSLTVRDLEILKSHQEICLAPNKIFKIFDQTEWRPQLYFATDRRIISYYQKELIEIDLPDMFISYYMNKDLKDIMEKFSSKENVNLFFIRSSIKENEIEFSSDLEDYVIEGRTIIYTMIQWAAYMGFKEIYILGVDFSYSDKTGYDVNNNDHFCKNYIEEGEEVGFSPMDYCKRAFEKAEEYSRKHNFRIYNATRGGKLEVFERVEFDKLMK